MIDILTNSEKVEDLNKQADKVEKCEKVAITVKEYEDIIRVKKKNIISLVYQQGRIFRKFKKKKKFKNPIKEFTLHKT